jgi:xanthine dehydrogenase accessory factor
MGFFERLAKLEHGGGKAVIATVIRTSGSVPRSAGTKMLILADGTREGTIGGGEMEAGVIQLARQVLEDGKPRIHTYAFKDWGDDSAGESRGEMEIYLEALNLSPKLLVIGTGHVGKAVVHLGAWLGFHVVIIDDREGCTTPEAVPDAHERIYCEPADFAAATVIHEQTYVVMTTRDLEIDLQVLPALLDSPAVFIGIIGSQRRWETTVARLIEGGIPADDLQRVNSPIGLDLKAETPEEIAVSILAQIIMVRYGGTGARMAHSPDFVRESEV